MTATFLAPPHFIYFIALGGGAGWGVAFTLCSSHTSKSHL